MNLHSHDTHICSYFVRTHKWIIIWDYIVHVNTGNYNDLIENNAAKLVAELHKSFTCGQGTTIGEFSPSEDVKPALHRVINQYGEKSIHIENNSGNITIN